MESSLLFVMEEALFSLIGVWTYAPWDSSSDSEPLDPGPLMWLLVSTLIASGLIHLGSRNVHSPSGLRSIPKPCFHGSKTLISF